MTVTLSSPPTAGAAQYVERTNAARRQDQPRAVRFRRRQQPVEQGGVGESADGGHEEVRATLQHALPVRANSFVARAFGHGIEVVGEELVGLVRQHAFLSRPAHQDGDQFNVLEAGCFDMLADRAVADQSQFHERRASTQRAQAMSWSSSRSGAINCTDSGRPNGPVLNGRAMQGVPSRVQKRLKIGSPV